jgi:excisionase family DNA binding protein
VEQLLSVKELAIYLKCTEQTIRRYILAKKIPYHKIDRMVRFWPSEIKEWVNSGKAVEITGKINDQDTLFAETEITEMFNTEDSQ